jgi:hypothetical protein
MADPVSWLLIRPGWRVHAADGSEVGRVEEVTGDSSADIFDGLAIAFSVTGKAALRARRAGRRDHREVSSS